MRPDELKASVKVLLSLQVKTHIYRRSEPHARSIATFANMLLQRGEEGANIVFDAADDDVDIGEEVCVDGR